MDFDEVDFEVVNAVDVSWNEIKKIPNYAEVAGEILFRKIFELAPIALNMYKFGPEFKGNEEELYKSEIFKAHARGVVQMLDATVNMLGPDLKPATKTLTMLGVRHIKYGVLPAHYGIVGEALLYTLEAALGDKWTPLVKKGWVGIYTFVSSAMMAGADHEVQRKLKRKQGRKTKNQSSSPVRQSSSPVRRDGPKKPSDQLASGEVRRRRRPPNNPLPRTAARLSDITGIPEVAGMAERRPNYSKFIDDALLDVSNHSVRTTETSSTPDTEEPLDEVSYYHMVENVYASWDKVRRIPNYAEVAGVLLFKEIFEIAPGAKALFKFTEGYEPDSDDLYTDPDFLKHATRVVRMLDITVNMLGPDLEPVTMALEELGARHVHYGVIPDHYPIVGEALLATLEAALGEAWTPTVKAGWSGIYTFVSTTMMKGPRESVREEKEDCLDAKGVERLTVGVQEQ